MNFLRVLLWFSLGMVLTHSGVAETEGPCPDGCVDTPVSKSVAVGQEYCYCEVRTDPWPMILSGFRGSEVIDSFRSLDPEECEALDGTEHESGNRWKCQKDRVTADESCEMAREMAERKAEEAECVASCTSSEGGDTAGQPCQKEGYYYDGSSSVAGFCTENFALNCKCPEGGSE